jgi:hypothetical protein
MDILAVAEYVFSKGRITVMREATLRIDKWRPHPLNPAFIVLDPHLIDHEQAPQDTVHMEEANNVTQEPTK